MPVNTEGNFNKHIDFKIENGIVHAVFKSDLLDLEMAKSMVSARIIISEGKTYPALADVRKVKKVTKEARRFFGSKEGAELLSASALYTDSAITSFLANFLNSVNIREKYIPVKVFSERDKALEWLETYKNKIN